MAARGEARQWSRLEWRFRMTGQSPTAVRAEPDSPVTARLLSVNVGLPRDVQWRGRTVHTGVWKHPVDGPQTVGTLNIDGDGQGDLAGHGGRTAR